MNNEDIVKNYITERDKILKLKNEAKLNKNKELFDIYKKKYFAISNRIDYYSNKDKPEFIEMKYRNNKKYIYKPENYERIIKCNKIYREKNRIESC